MDEIQIRNQCVAYAIANDWDHDPAEIVRAAALFYDFIRDRKPEMQEQPQADQVG